MSWSLLLASFGGFGVVVAEVVLKDGRGETGALIATGGCLSALMLLEAAQAAARWQGRRRIRENGLRTYSAAHSRRARPPQGADAGAPRAGAGAARLDGQLADLTAEVRACRHQVADMAPRLDYVAGIVIEAHEREDVEVPEALRPAAKTLPIPPVWLAAVDGECVDGRQLGA